MPIAVLIVPFKVVINRPRSYAVQTSFDTIWFSRTPFEVFDYTAIVGPTPNAFRFDFRSTYKVDDGKMTIDN